MLRLWLTLMKIVINLFLTSKWGITLSFGVILLSKQGMCISFLATVDPCLLHGILQRCSTMQLYGRGINKRLFIIQ